MNVYTLYAVTTLGVLLSLFLILFIFLGKFIARADGSPQRIRFAGFEVQSNLVAALLIVSVVTAILPLCLEFYLILIGAIGVPQQIPRATRISEIIPIAEITPALNTIISKRTCEALKGNYRLHSDYVISEGAGTRLTAKRASWNATSCEPSKEAGVFVLKGEDSTDYDIEVSINNTYVPVASGTTTHSSEVLIGESGRLISRISEIDKNPPKLKKYNIDPDKNGTMKDQSDIDRKIKAALEIREKKYEGQAIQHCTPTLGTTAGRTIFIFICEGYTRAMVELF